MATIARPAIFSGGATVGPGHQILHGVVLNGDRVHDATRNVAAMIFLPARGTSAFKATLIAQGCNLILMFRKRSIDATKERLIRRHNW